MDYFNMLWNGLQAMLAWALSHPDEAAQTGVLIAAGIGALRRWAVAKKADRFAQFVDALGRSAGRIFEALKKVPAGTTPEQFKQQLIAAELRGQLTEYAETVRKIGATPVKAENILRGELDKLSAAVPIVNIIAGPAADGLTGRGA